MASRYGNEAYSALWQTVINHVIADLKSGSIWHETRDQQVAESWIGQFPSSDFREVCINAGLDPDAAHYRLRQLIARDRKYRAAKREELKDTKQYTHWLYRQKQESKHR